MPEPNTHAAVGLGIAYAAGKALGLNPDFLVAGVVGALFAVARQDHKSAEQKTLMQTGLDVFWAMINIGGVGFFAASITEIFLEWNHSFVHVGTPIVGLIGFFGQPVIAALTEFITKGWKSKFGVKDD